MSDQNILTLRDVDRLGDRGLNEAQPQADQARTDFALLESHLETIAGQIARVPTRAFPCRILFVADSEHLLSARGGVC